MYHVGTTCTLQGLNELLTKSSDVLHHLNFKLCCVVLNTALPLRACRCTASSLTLGTCLPGQYTLQYSVANLEGLQSAGFITVLVEQYSVASFDYMFTVTNR